MHVRFWLDGHHVLDGELLREQPDDVPERRDVRGRSVVSVLLLQLRGRVLWAHVRHRSVRLKVARPVHVVLLTAAWW